MNMNRFFIICSLLLSIVGGGSVIQAADSWNYPTKKPETPFGGGDGSQWNPYRIETAQHLANLAYMVTDDNTEYHGKYFVLTNDITLNDNVINEEGTGLANAEGSYKLWTPIGEYGITADDDFRGFFDGQGHTISGLVCISEDGKRDYLALFGTTDDATIKNLNMKDSYVCTKATDSNSQSFGMLIGTSMNTTVINCHVANSVVNVTHTFTKEVLERDCCVGGLIGCCDYVAGYSFADYKTIMTNCSFSGKIYTTLNGENNALYVGGLFGYQTDRADGSVDLTNCNTEGDIYINVLQNVYEICGGGIAACICKWKDSDLKRCVSRMNITVESGNNTIKECYLSGFCSVDSKTNYNHLQRVSQCASLGTIKVGTAANKAKITNLYLGGFSYWYGYLSSCAFYGKFDVHSEGREIRITPLAKFLCKFDNTPSVVCSVGNVIDINYSKTTNLDQVSTYTYRQETEGYNHFRVDTHNYYYRFENTSGVTVPCNGTADASKYNKTLEQMKTDDFIKTLNQEATSNVWGKLTGTNSDLDGLPMPISCGGKPLEYPGDGTSESTAYIINTEADLNKLKEYVNNGTAFDGKYFKLGSDINMTEIMDYSIGFYKEKPFKGHLDGNGHAIVGLRNQLFGYMYGTVKNLAIIDCYIKSQGWTGAIAGSVGYENNKAEVSNCYVSGLVQASGSTQILLGGICGNVASGSSVHDSYFKGHLIVESGYNSSGGSHFVGGISGYNGGKVDTTTPQGIYNCYASFKYQKPTSSCFLYGISNGGVKDCYVVTSATIDYENSGCTKLDSESELNEQFKDKAGWLQGVYRPVLAYAKKYAATTPEKTPTTVYFDAIPEANPTANYFYNISIEDPYSDVSLWSLPNMAVYVPSERKDYITNGNLVQSAEFQYKRSAGATATEGQLRYDLTQNASGYHMLCLPGVVKRGDLPKDSKVMIYGKIRTVGTSQEINEVHVDTIPAGVPCILYVPVTAYNVGSDIPLVMRGEIRSEPLLDAKYSNMKGTFKTVANVSDACITATKREDGNVYFEKSEATHNMEPFTAWLEGAAGDVKIVDYILLDEENEAMTVTLAGLNSTKASPKTTNVKMRRTVKLGQWNTICLPFDLTKTEVENVFGSGTKVEELSSLNYDSTSKSYTLVFAAVKEADGSLMKAGVPYLIKPGTTKSDEKTSVQLYGFSNKNIICPADENYLYIPDGKEVTNNVNSTKLTMQGEYNHRMISPDEATDVKSIYVISGNKIYYVDSEVEMKGFRCYFVAEETVSGSGAKLFSGARLMHSDGTSTELRLIKAEPTGDADAVYDLLGRKCVEQTKGVVIKNGKKRIVK